MLGRKLYKTKLCTLFQKGRCLRQNCNFAHGDAELRRFGGSFNGRREHRISDLRDKLDRRHSPYRRYSPARDARGHHSFYNKKPASYDKGSSLSPSPVRSVKRDKKKQVDGNSDVSEDLRVSEGPQDRKKEKASSTDEKDAFEEQLKHIQLEIEALDDENHQLEILLEEKVEESKKLSDRVEELESQLNKEQEDRKRISSRIEKFTKVHGRYIKAQEELKRLQNRLRRLVDQNSSDILKPSVNEENSGENAFGDREPDSGNKMSQRNFELPHNGLHSKKRSLGYPTTSEEAKIGDPRKRERLSEAMHKSEKFIGSEGPAQQSSSLTKGTDTIRALINKYRSPANVLKHKHGKHSSNHTTFSDKAKGSEARHSLPSTGMAAHAVDEFNETIELIDKTEALGGTIVVENGVTDNVIKSYMPPPPPLLNAKDTYKQYEGDDEDVDVEKVDDEMLDIDLNSEVEIEQV